MKTVLGVYFENGTAKAIKAEFKHKHTKETTDIVSATRALRKVAKKDYVKIYAQNSNNHYVGISCGHSGEKGFEKYEADLARNYTTEMVVREIEKLI